MLQYLKKKKYVYLTSNHLSTYKMFNKNNEIMYYDTNIIKILDELGFIKTNKYPIRNVVLETERTPNETYKLFNLNTKRNITTSTRRSINIYMDDTNNIEPLLKLNNSINKNKLADTIKYFNTDNVKTEIYYAKINPEQYVNNYRFLLKEEDYKNDMLNEKIQNFNIKKTNSLINKNIKNITN